MNGSTKGWAWTWRRIRRGLGLITWVSCLGAMSQAEAQTNASAPLPPAAQNLLDQGVAAARKDDYPLALRLLEDARKAAPGAAIVYLNLGLAESKIPGRELRAMAWFGAYLAANPNAPNAAAVKAEIAVLKVRRRANMARLIESAHDAASFLDPSPRDTLLYHVATAEAKMGDIADAERVTLEIKSADSRTAAAISIAEEQVSAGDLSGARRTLDAALKSAGRIGGETEVGMLTSAHAMARSYGGIAQAQAAAGDLSAAFRTANLIPASDYKVTAQVAIAKVQARAGDRAGARKAFAAAQHTVDTMPKPSENVFYKAYSQISIAEAQSAIADVEEAQRTLAAARRALASAGTADAASRGYLLEAIAKVSLSMGQAGAAPDTHDTCNPSGEKTTVKASDWIAILIDNDAKHACPLNISPFLDLSAQLGVLRQHTASSASFVLGDVMEQVGMAEKAVDEMLARQLGH